MQSTIKYVNERIEFLNSVNLCNKSFVAIQKILIKSFTFPYHIFPFKSKSKIFRGQLCSKTAFDKISRLSYNPKPASVLGRANLINESVFYASMSLDTAAIESCQDQLRNGTLEFLVTVGEWELQKDLQIDLLCHSQKAQSTGTDLAVAAESIDSMMRKDRTEDQYLSMLAKSQFFSDQYAKSIINCPHDYAYSAIYSSQILYPQNKICDGICYPSVAYKLKDFNVVFHKDLVDSKAIKFICAHLISLKFEDDDKYPQLEKKKTSSSIKDDLIIW